VEAREYHLKNPDVALMLQRFRDDSTRNLAAHPLPRDGRMLMCAVTPFVNKDGTSARTVAAHLLTSCPGSKVIIVTAGGCTVVSDASAVPDHLDKSTVARYPNGKLMTLSAIIDAAPLEVPLFIVGYNCVGRSVSVRGANRVITHIIAGLGGGRNSADVSQLCMRGSGRTKELRAAHGFDHIEVLMTEEDLSLVRRLYDFTQEAITVAGTGEPDGLQCWMDKEKGPEHDAVVNSLRRHAKPKMRAEETLNIARAPGALMDWQKVLLVAYELAEAAPDGIVTVAQLKLSEAIDVEKDNRIALSHCANRYEVLEKVSDAHDGQYRLTQKGVAAGKSLLAKVAAAGEAAAEQATAEPPPSTPAPVPAAAPLASPPPHLTARVGRRPAGRSLNFEA